MSFVGTRDHHLYCHIIIPSSSPSYTIIIFNDFPTVVNRCYPNQPCAHIYTWTTGQPKKIGSTNSWPKNWFNQFLVFRKLRISKGKTWETQKVRKCDTVWRCRTPAMDLSENLTARATVRHWETNFWPQWNASIGKTAMDLSEII